MRANGSEPLIHNDSVHISQKLLIPFTNKEESLKQLIDQVYPNLQRFADNDYSYINRIIFITKNDFVDHINSTLIETFLEKALNMPAEIKSYLSTSSLRGFCK